jgi:hypothetical protein
MGDILVELVSRNIKKLLEHNIGVDKNSIHLFKSDTKGYIILKFDGNSNFIDEEVFNDDIDKAVERFMELVKI